MKFIHLHRADRLAMPAAEGVMRSFSFFHVVAIATACIPGLTSCTSAKVAMVPQAPLSRPNVVMAADPQPPLTYWAPENSTIRNHPHQPGIWIAESLDGSRKFYFGDKCHASAFQRFVGQPVDALSPQPAGVRWRLSCSTCANTSDLDWERMNVSYDQKTGTIHDISCG